MKSPVYDIMLSYFCADDELRPAMNFPSLRGEYVYATDAHILAKIPVANLTKTYTENEKFPNAEHILQQYDFSCQLKVNTEDLLSAISTLNMHRAYTYIKCDTCDGSGTLECEHCGSDYECEDCKGTGNAGKKYAKISVLVCKEEDKCLVKIGRHLFNPKYILIVAMFAQMLGEKTIRFDFTHTGKYDPVLFKFADVTSLVMPKTVDEAYESEYNIKEIQIK